MTHAENILAQLADSGITAELHNNAIRLHPRERVPPELVALVLESKASILAVLAGMPHAARAIERFIETAEPDGRGGWVVPGRRRPVFTTDVV